MGRSTSKRDSSFYEVDGASSSSNAVSFNADHLLQPYYKIHAGKNRFFCRGRCVMSQQMGLFFLNLFLLLLGSTLFFAFDARYLAESLSPAVGAVGGLMFIFVLAVLIRASCSDPGIIPRATKFDQEWMEGWYFVYYGNFIIGFAPTNLSKNTA